MSQFFIFHKHQDILFFQVNTISYTLTHQFYENRTVRRLLAFFSSFFRFILSANHYQKELSLSCRFYLTITLKKIQIILVVFYHCIKLILRPFQGVDQLFLLHLCLWLALHQRKFLSKFSRLKWVLSSFQKKKKKKSRLYSLSQQTKNLPFSNYLLRCHAKHKTYQKCSNMTSMKSRSQTI